MSESEHECEGMPQLSSLPPPRLGSPPAGEFQFAFLAFLLGQSLEGFTQWRDILALMFGCEAAPLGPRAALFARFLDALHAQLEHSLVGGRAAEAQVGG